MRALVTGGSGFIGAALCADLLGAGHAVVALDNNSRGRARRLTSIANDIEFIQGDVTDPDQVLAASRGIDVVYHLAYINGTRFFYERPDEVLEVGIKGTLNTLEAALAQGVSRYVLASTSETYNEPLEVPTTEHEPLKIPDVTNPRFSYGGGKIAAELMTLHIGGKRGLDTVIFRPHNIYGPDMGNEHVIPELTRRIVWLTEGLSRSSVDLPIQGDGSETRSFCYISDAAQGALIAGQSGQPGEIYHLGTEREISVGDLAVMIGDSLNIRVRVVPGQLRRGGTRRRCPDITKLRSIGFEPEVALEEGVRDTARWYAERALDSFNPEDVDA